MLISGRSARAVTLILASMLVGLPVWAEEAAKAPTLQVTPVTDNLYMLSGEGGNLGLFVGDEAAVLIDDQFAPVHPLILEQIQKLSPAEASSRTFVLNTHFHPDHTHGNELMGEAGGIIVAHENARQRLTVEQIVPFFNVKNPPLTPAGLPVVTFRSDVTLHLNGEEIELTWVGPAHTDGDAIVHFRGANVIHGGDIVFFGTYPFIDLDNGGSVDGLVTAAERVLALCDDATKIIPGHGPLIGTEQLRSYVEMLRTTRDRVAALLAQGKTADEIQAAKPTAEFDEAWNTYIGTEAYVGFLVRGLSAK